MNDSPLDFRVICDQLPIGVFVLDRELRVRYWNEWLGDKTGVGAERALGHRLEELFDNLRLDRFHWAAEQCIRYHIPHLLSQTLNRYLLPVQMSVADRHGLPMMQQKVSVLPIQDRHGESQALVIVQDVTESVVRSSAMAEMVQKLREVSLRDPLTDLFNRRFMWEWLEQQVRESARYHRFLGCLMLDIDRFKQLNDNYGHQRGDDILRKFAEVVQDTLRDADILIRYGGEEFAAFLPNTTLDQALASATRILDMVRGTGMAGFRPGEVTCSIGASVFDPMAPVSAQELIELADRQLYEAKNGGRDQVRPLPRVSTHSN
ncbi:MAG: diguanylate cyclase [Chromatiales bacterium]|jgi:diguanylate cyclase (GGDEF)-like protein|nr:diguanylate cyclase [Chromatiales bacterium]MDX9766112.1 diguanylate cyclase [Ectothiorhodospiraceae bacterium]